jgi:thymidylate synthase
MRLFQNIREAYQEIQRDINKSPKMEIHRVQDKVITAEAHEAMGYSYSVVDIPISVGDILQLSKDLGYLLPLVIDDTDMEDWLRAEVTARTSPHWHPEEITELINPQLARCLEGAEPSYTYRDRLHGMVEILAHQLYLSPDSRRAYWPMFNVEDSYSAARQTRVPCTLGYWVAIRKVGGVDRLHLTYLERSCDFDRFWLWDLFFARVLQEQIRRSINLKHEMAYNNSSMANKPIWVEMGLTTHTILSFHQIRSVDGGEIY